MFILGEIVRCPIDLSEKFNREFAIGKISAIDDASKMLTVMFYDTNNLKIYYDMPSQTFYFYHQVKHTRVNINSKVKYNNELMIVKAYYKSKENGLYYYYLANDKNNIFLVSEINIYCGFNDGYINPFIQFKNMEFQNPKWYFGRSIVSKAMNNINTALYGFKILTGCKIILKAHQIRTVMRCLRNENCRIMLADEVGMGKTIEALSVLKVYLNDAENKKVSIIVPKSLKEQWITELAFKFKLFEDVNNIKVLSFDELDCYNNDSDFLIIDEVHRILRDSKLYNKILNISINSKNIIMLSATPLQKRNEEYKKLLTLIQPSKYLNMSNIAFDAILNKQSTIVKKIFNLRIDLDSYIEEIENLNNQSKEDLPELFEEIIDEFESLNNLLNDDYIDNIIKNIRYDSNDFGVTGIKRLLSYICENYQLERAIIRNRRTKDLEDESNVRELIDKSYDIEDQENEMEYKCYQALNEWIETLSLDLTNYKLYIVPLVNSLFSSAKAFNAKIELIKKKFDVPQKLIELANVFLNHENSIVRKIKNIVDNDKNDSRLVNIINYLEQECFDGKSLIFTDFNDTFELYKKVLSVLFGPEYCAFFNANMDRDELESNVYRFQNDGNCKILLSDKSGGEGRNFQIADYLINIDLPWNANDIEQRIGRLDRIGRDSNKPVRSVVFYAKNSLEEDLFNIWNKGLNIFKKSQTGLEIIMQDISDMIIDNIRTNFKFGLSLAMEQILNLVSIQANELKKERMFDISSYEYKNIYLNIERTLNIFNKNEKSFFSDAMLGWASMTGFNASVDGNNTYTFSRNSLSFNSLKNTLFVPPNMQLIISDKLNQMRNRIRNLCGEKDKKLDTSYIRGTFDRQTANQNDYLNFFAPGDPIFDSIVNNSLTSYRGTCSAIKSHASINWKGFIFTWKIELDESFIYKNSISKHIFDEYRGFLPRSFEINAYCLNIGDDLTDLALKYYKKLCLDKKLQNRVIHLGKRSDNNFKKFLKEFSKEDWEDLVSRAYKEMSKQALEIIKKRYGIELRKVGQELEDRYNATYYSHKYFESQIDMEQLAKEKQIILDGLKQIKIILDSVCYLELDNGE